MDELKLLIEMVANLPQMALWVLVSFWAYKVVVIGSIYGAIRLAIVKLHDWLTTPKKVEMKIGGNLIDEATAAALNAQIARIKDGAYSHIRMSDVQKLREALDAKFKESK